MSPPDPLPPAPPPDPPGGIVALLGWRLVVAIGVGLGGCLVLEWRQDFASVDFGACLSVLGVAAGAGLVWEIATVRARCGFRPLE